MDQQLEKVSVSIPEQITKALDGRTYRWLAFEVRIPESDLSRKMNGKKDFTDDELIKIQDRLGFKINN